MKPRALHGRLDALARQHQQAMTEPRVELHLPSNGRDLERPDDEMQSIPWWAPRVVLFERSNVRFVLPSNGRRACASTFHRQGGPEIHSYDVASGACEFPGCAELHGDRTGRGRELLEGADDVGDGPPRADDGSDQ